MTEPEAPSSNRSQVVLCDDHPIWRSGVRADCSRDPACFSLVTV
ncbi:MAG: hypothetical protein R2754_08965 [Microthrixaceae bacterium]